MKILYVLENYYPSVGGVETLFQSLIENMAKNHEVTVITSRPKDSLAHEIYHGVKIERVWTPPGSLRRYIYTLSAILPAIKASRTVDIIHTTTYNAAIPAWIASVITGKKVVITVHEVLDKLWFSLPMFSISKFFHWSFERLVISLPFSRYLAVSDYTKNCLVGWFGKNPEQVTRIYNGIDYKFWDQKKYPKNTKRTELGVTAKTFVYLYFGRTGWVKGIETLLDVVPEIAKRIPGSKLVLLLFPEPRARYHAILNKINELQITKDVIVRTSVPKGELPLYIRSANVVVIPSLSEGFGFSAVEAQALGLPVVAHAAGSLPEVCNSKNLYRTHKDLVQWLLRNHKKQPGNKFPLVDMSQKYAEVYEKT